MDTIPATAIPHTPDTDWVVFSGGELEGRRPRALCATCREALNRNANSRLPGRSRPHTVPGRGGSRPVCFQCYRAELGRERALKAAGELDTASEPRFQTALPLEPVNKARLERLRRERGAARMIAQSGVGRFVDRRRRAQIAARHALQRLAGGLRARGGAELPRDAVAPPHAAGLHLPESWLPFVASR